MAARRRKRGRRNRGRFGFLYKVLSTLLILAAILTGCIVFFRVDEIIVTGGSRYSAEQVIEAAGIKQGENLFQLNKFDIARQVLTKLPYVDEITISRKLPATLILKVTESTAVAALEHDGVWWLVDARCKLLEQGDAALAQGRAELTGLSPLSPSIGLRLAVEEDQQRKLDSLSQLLSALQEQGMVGKISEFIDLSSDNMVRFGYSGAFTVEMPLYDDFDSQVWKLRRALEELEAKNGAVSGTLHLPTEGNKAWLLSERWLPESTTTEPETAPGPGEGTQPVSSSVP